MNKTNAKMQTVGPGGSLVDLVFSWSIQDVLNKDIYKGQVQKIPMTFSSKTEYLNSFIPPFLEELRTYLMTNMTVLDQAPLCEIKSVEKGKDYKLPKDLLYDVTVEKGKYEPEFGDLFAITDVRPKYAGDLDRPQRPYLIAHVQGIYTDEAGIPVAYSILSSKPVLEVEMNTENRTRITLFAVKLINLKTNVRIWNALSRVQDEQSVDILQKVLQPETMDAENCIVCHFTKSNNSNMDVRTRISSSDLNEFQKALVLRCIGTRECDHQNSFKLIWGPPGTGKTKTLGFLLHSLLTMKCRTLTCAPTNIAVLEVTRRLMNNVTESLEDHTYGLGDIVLLGNKKRMNIDDHDELFDIFLDNRADILDKCFNPLSGWTSSLNSMICLLKDPEEQYQLYLKQREEEDDEEDDANFADEEENFKTENGKNINNNQEEDVGDELSKVKQRKKVWNKVIVQILKENKSKKKPKNILSMQKQNQSNHNGKKCDPPLSFEEFVKSRYDCIGERLCLWIESLYTHLPTSFISLEVARKMIKARESLRSFVALLQNVTSGVLKEVFNEDVMFNISSTNCLDLVMFNTSRINCLALFLSLPQSFNIPFFEKKWEVKRFCLENTILVFCTVSSSSKLYATAPFELLVIDEASQLKECESAIPLQLPGIRHAILIGDERQLPAMVESKISERAEFGRSLFERFSMQGYKKHLLSVQHRMHPSISLFPNREFYGGQILDGPNVQERSYSRRFLQDKMYGCYSFINVAQGKEDFNGRHSRRNMVEVAVVSEIVECLYKVSVRTVDGFQGGEEDVIIISTVRCNGTGSVGFLSSRPRANVALTRARYCLWILGNEGTLLNSESIWKKVVNDAKDRGCFRNAHENKNLAHAITASLVDLNQLNVLTNMNFLLFKEARWKVCFNDAFWKSMAGVKNNELFKKVLSLLENFSCGQRQLDECRNVIGHDRISSQLLECYRVNNQLYLAWFIDIATMDSSHYYTQVVKVWDILPLSAVQKLADQLDEMFGNYTVNKMNRCKHKCTEGTLVVPMKWPMDSSSWSLTNSLASLSLREGYEAYPTN
ncbi:uncharacterized protein LOC107410487 isoform X2 [Ziziphus jujuba]|uniref:Uncharacterized protein LOC107410487 isoform X2 n=1 Tax=Ziziphus jujuba TaxID=326968 RepID=A0ABM3ZXV9_ZIZJJ|nr:uncharacterized protein LOC107410487 isoform X2 [Ziziphus jujuba]